MAHLNHFETQEVPQVLVEGNPQREDITLLSDPSVRQTTLSLQVSEVYASIQGESSFQGQPCVFIRLTGCPLRCRWCDTAHAFEGGKRRTFADIIHQVRGFGISLVELTGGEPLAQEETPALMQALVDEGFTVLVETGGSEPIDAVPTAVRVIMDIKCPGSGMEQKNRWENLAVLRPHDEIKMVLADRADFEWAVRVAEDHRLFERFKVLFSCAWGLLNPKDLARWMVESRVPATLQLQQHKYIWGPRAKGV